MKKFSITCDFGGKEFPFYIYVGSPKRSKHPLEYQARWLNKERGGTIPVAIMDAFRKLHSVALENTTDFEELCAFSFKEKEIVVGAENPDADVIPASSNSGPSFPVVIRNGQSDEEIVRNYIRMGNLLWPEPVALSSHCRLFFLGLSLYLHKVSDSSSLLSEIYRTLSLDDLLYRLHVILDIYGNVIPPLGFNLIAQYVQYPVVLRQDVVASTIAAMTTFALSDDPQNPIWDDLRKTIIQ